MQRLVKFQKFSWVLPWLKRFGLQCIVFSFFLSNFSCESPKQNLLIDKEDREVVDDFLRHIAISELGVYTILGSKPISWFHIPQVQPEDELRKRYEAMPNDFRKKISFEKYNTNKQIEKLGEICKKWMKIQHKYVGEHFAIQFDEEMRSGILVNIPLATYALRKYYQDFSSVFGSDFDQAVFAKEIGNYSSEFWKTIKKNHYLMGLLFGFGEKNSKFFQWEQEKSISFPFRVASYNSPWLKKRRFSKFAVEEKIENLSIPQFIVYQPVDEAVEKYLLEKERIIQIYKNRDFAETTVAFLKGEAVHQLSKRKKSISVQKVD
ncbi:MAG: hypothetical protein KR126chlam3_01369 [Chlamydiae bacterium]|nr:hypothetical protein [Chlamydiota bacterium]